MSWRTTVYERIDDVPEDAWQSLARDDADLAMDRRLLASFESAMRDQCRTWYAIVRDSGGACVAGACLSVFKIDALETTGPAARRITAAIRKLLSGYMRFNVLFCGLPAPSAENHLRILPGADLASVLSQLDRTMRELARKHRARLLVLKEFNASRRDELLDLEAIGYIRGDVPAARILDRSFGSFDEYLGALRAQYRKQVKESLRKLERNECIVEHLHGRQITARMTPELQALYLQVRDRAKYRMETFPLAFFQDVATRFGDAAAMTVIRQDQKVLGWAFSLTLGGECHNLYIGLDYANNANSDVYFNLHYFDLKRAFAAGASRIHLGQTSDEFKSRLGCAAQPLSFYVRAVNPLIHWGLRKFARLAFPPVESPRLLNVFRAESNSPVHDETRNTERAQR